MTYLLALAASFVLAAVVVWWRTRRRRRAIERAARLASALERAHRSAGTTQGPDALLGLLDRYRDWHDWQ